MAKKVMAVVKLQCPAGKATQTAHPRRAGPPPGGTRPPARKTVRPLRAATPTANEVTGPRGGAAGEGGGADESRKPPARHLPAADSAYRPSADAERAVRRLR